VGLVGREVDSYRQLPVLLCRPASRSQPASASRAGLFGSAEQPVLQVTAFGGQNSTVTEDQVAGALGRILAACGLAAEWAKAGERDRQALLAHPAGDLEVVRCPSCGYASERSWATTAWPAPPGEPELPPEEVSTPGCDTIASLAAFLQIAAAQTLKMVFYSVESKVTCLVIRGDRSVDEAKLARVLGTRWYYSSLEDELEAIGAVGGYASPIGLDPRRVRVVADPSVRSGQNYVSGANRPDYHIRNVNVPRDFVPGEWADLALIQPGDPCPGCGTALTVERGFALAHKAAAVPCGAGAEYLDPEGRPQPLWMATWELYLGRLLAAVAERHHDDHGLAWPTGCAPLDVHIVGLDLRLPEVAERAEALYERLQAEGLAVLYDDRDASAGVKFNDADLIGLPLRLTASKRWLADGAIEAKWRTSPDRLKLDDTALAVELARLGMHKA
jgi:prolyl-tRNA synthetase